MNTTSGVICLENNGIEYLICKIDYHYFDDDNFSYIFTPYYEVIDLLDSKLFQGIPGLTLDLREKQYERKNIIPVFISERTPAENRVNKWEMLEEVGMTYLNQLEWLIRTNERYFGDNLYVKRYEDGKILNKITAKTKFQRFDNIQISSIKDISSSLLLRIQTLLNVITSGSELCSDELIINNANRKEYYKLLKAIVDSQVEETKKKGRMKMDVSLPLLEETYNSFKQGIITEKQAMEKMGIKSRSTFYRRVAELKKIDRK